MFAHFKKVVDRAIKGALICFLFFNVLAIVFSSIIFTFVIFLYIIYDFRNFKASITRKKKLHNKL